MSADYIAAIDYDWSGLSLARGNGCSSQLMDDRRVGTYAAGMVADWCDCLPAQLGMALGMMGMPNADLFHRRYSKHVRPKLGQRTVYSLQPYQRLWLLLMVTLKDKQMGNRHRRWGKNVSIVSAIRAFSKLMVIIVNWCSITTSPPAGRQHKDAGGKPLAQELHRWLAAIVVTLTAMER